MSIDVIIDSREGKLIEALESTYLKKECDHLLFDIAPLDVGDIVYKLGERWLCLIERKTMDDYVSSIADRRSKNQAMRIVELRKEHPQLLVIYLIEGAFIPKDSCYRNGITRDALYSSIIHRVVQDHFTIYRTADINDTALVVTKIYDKLTDLVTDEQIPDQRIEYLKTIKTVKKENLTALNCYVCQLSQIPGVSIEMADTIAKTYPTMAQLIMEYQRLGTTACQRLLSEIMIPIVHDKSRRLGHILSKRIYEYLWGNSQPQPDPPKSKITLKVKTSV